MTLKIVDYFMTIEIVMVILKGNLYLKEQLKHAQTKIFRWNPLPLF